VSKIEFNTEVNEGVATLVAKDENLYLADTDISKQTFKDVADHNAKYIETVMTAAKESATALMEKDKSVDKVFVQTPYTVSKRGALDVEIKRSHTYPGMNGAPAVTKSTMKVKVTDPFAKPVKSTLKGLESEMTKALLG